MLKTRLLDGLLQFRVQKDTGVIPHAPGIFSYCALSRERLAFVTLPYPIVGVVLSGTKEIYRADRKERLVAGAMFVLPGQVGLDIVNEPDARSSLYQSLILEIEPNALPDLPVRSTYGSWQNNGHAIALTAASVEATLHATRALVQGAANATIRKARLTELLALLGDVPAARRLMAQGMGSGAAALAVGYASRAHFARAFRATLGSNPAQIDWRENP